MDTKEDKDDELLRIALSRGIFFHSAEVFSDNISGFWDYGPIGVRILNNLLDQWRQTVYSMNGFEISGSVILPKIVLQASGHEANFFDMEIKCSKCGTVYRVDKLLEEKDSSKNFEGLTEEEYLKYIREYSIKCSGLSQISVNDALSNGVIKNTVTAYGIEKVHEFLLRVGFKNEDIRYRKLYEDKAFYSKESFDIEIRKQDIWVELVACNNRGEHDLSAYEEFGAKGLRVDGKIPQIFEISMGTDRLFYSLYLV